MSAVPAYEAQPVDGSALAELAEEPPEKLFSQSILISAIRCTLTYVIFPFVAPIVGIASGIGSTIGLIVGSIAIVANVFSIRRFWRADHKYKIPVSVLNLGIIVLLIVLVVFDANNLFS